MSATFAEAKFFSTQPSTPSTATAPAPQKLRPWLDGWSMANLLYPLLKEGNYVWTDDRRSCLYLGTREMYREWLSAQETLPNPTNTVGFYPLGLVLCVVNGERVHNSGHTNRSNACADGTDFKALAYALSDRPGEVGTGVYTTYCKHFGVERPKYFFFDKEEEENNFLQEFFASRK